MGGLLRLPSPLHLATVTWTWRKGSRGRRLPTGSSSRVDAAMARRRATHTATGRGSGGGAVAASVARSATVAAAASASGAGRRSDGAAAAGRRAETRSGARRRSGGADAAAAAAASGHGEIDAEGALLSVAACVLRHASLVRLDPRRTKGPPVRSTSAAKVVVVCPALPRQQHKLFMPAAETCMGLSICYTAEVIKRRTWRVCTRRQKEAAGSLRELCKRACGPPWAEQQK